MFHVNAWGIPFNAALSGAKLVLPGPRYDGEAIYELIEEEGVTCTAGVPTIWHGLLEHMRKNGLKFSCPPRLVIGGAAAPLAMVRAFEEELGCTVFHAWGMTEMSPVGTTGKLKPRLAALPREERYKYKLKQGQGLWGVEMKIVGPSGERLLHDGKAFGELLVRGPCIIGGYFNDPKATAAAFDAEGWFRTGDVATIDEDGIVQLVDRAKDVIKSGGEWISSIDLESTASGHPDLAQVAVIGLPHPKWGERPLLIAVPKPGRSPVRAEIIGFLRGKVANLCLPNDVVFVDSLPLTATGKISKLQLRQAFKGHLWPDVRRTGTENR
jgi:fatty-acyl-CoA synthase